MFRSLRQIPAKSVVANTPFVEPRLYITREQVEEIDQRSRIERCVRRYMLLRQFAKGVVCDAACGTGYGTHLLASNPDVSLAIGVDQDLDAIAFAERNFSAARIRFEEGRLETWSANQKIDQLFSVETIEHLADPSVLTRFVERNDIHEVILTYPSKKTTHYNPFHYHDFTPRDIGLLFSRFEMYSFFNCEHEFDVIFLRRVFSRG